MNLAAQFTNNHLKLFDIWRVSGNCGGISMDFLFIGFLDVPRISKIEDRS